MSIKTDPLAAGPFTITNVGSGGTNSVIGISGGDVIQGKMIVVNKTYSIDEIERLGLKHHVHVHYDTIKAELIEMLMAKVIQNKCIEFTKQDNFVENSITFRARIFATPDDMVRFIRKNDKG